MPRREPADRNGDQEPEPGASDRPTLAALRAGWILLAVFLPLGLVLESLHAMKVPVYFRSALRRELWTLAHAHGNMLGLLCLAFAALGRRTVPGAKERAAVSKLLVVGAWMMPLGFFFGGVQNTEGDPSIFILAVPAGGVLLLIALLRAGLSARV